MNNKDSIIVNLYSKKYGIVVLQGYTPSSLYKVWPRYWCYIDTVSDLINCFVICKI